MNFVREYMSGAGGSNHSLKHVRYLYVARKAGVGEGGGGTEQIFVPGGSSPRSNPLPFYIPFFTKKGTPFVYLLATNGTPFLIPCLEL